MLTQLTQVSYAFTTIGSVDEKVPLGPAVLMQYAVAFTNLVLPTGAASTLMNIRFLQKQGSSVAVATSSGVLVGLSGTVTQFFLFFFTAWAVGQQVDTGEIGGTAARRRREADPPRAWSPPRCWSASCSSCRSSAGSRRRRCGRSSGTGSTTCGAWSRTPRKLFLVMGGSIGAQLLNSLGLGAALLAYGASLPFGELILVVTGAGFISSLVPVPGGIGVAEASLIAGLTAFGVPPGGGVGRGRHLPALHDVSSTDPRQLRHEVADRERRPVVRSTCPPNASRRPQGVPPVPGLIGDSSGSTVWQQRRRTASFLVAVFFRYWEDRGRQYGALLLSTTALCPCSRCSLVLVTVLGIVLDDNADLRNRILDTVYAIIPVVGAQLRENTDEPQLERPGPARGAPRLALVRTGGGEACGRTC